MTSINLGKKIIDNDNLYFIADIGANHNGSLDKALELIHKVKESGGDAAKFQNFSADKIVSNYGFDKMANKLSHQSNWKKSVYEVYKEASIDKDWTSILKKECESIGIDYFTSPYDFASVDLVDRHVDMYKLGSGDITWLEIVDHILSKKKPLLIATGASSLEDVIRVMNYALTKTKELVLMQCNTNYTGSVNNFKYINLNVLRSYASLYPEVMLGLSDHTPGHSTVLGGIALGARVIEKHFTDDNNQEGPDHNFAMNPASWSEMVERSYELLNALGDGKKLVEKNELDSIYVQRRAICASRSLVQGHVIDRNDLVMLRPFFDGAYHPYQIDMLIGKRLHSNVAKGKAFLKEESND